MENLLINKNNKPYYNPKKEDSTPLELPKKELTIEYLKYSTEYSKKTEPENTPLETPKNKHLESSKTGEPQNGGLTRENTAGRELLSPHRPLELIVVYGKEISNALDTPPPRLVYTTKTRKEDNLKVTITLPQHRKLL